MTHYEIGHAKATGTKFIFSTSSLIEVLKEWSIKEYQEENGYFMDIWVQHGPEEINFPIVSLKPENIDFKTLKELL